MHNTVIPCWIYRIGYTTLDIPCWIQYTTAFDESWPDPRVGSGGFQTFAGRVGSAQEVLETSRVESGRAGSGEDDFKISGPVGSGRFQVSRVGQGGVGLG